MPPRSAKRGSQIKVQASVDSDKADDVYVSGIASLQRLAKQFERELAELKKLNMEQHIPEHTDSDSRRRRIIFLLEEFSVLADQEPAFTPDLRTGVRNFHKQLLFALSSGETTKVIAAPEKAPELFSERKDKEETAIDFTVRVYKQFEGAISFRDIRRLDFSLYNSLCIAKSKGERFPDGFSLPSRKQVSDNRLARLGIDINAVGDDAPGTLRTLRAVQRRIEKQLKR